MTTCRSSTLKKITKRCADDVVAQLNEALLSKANANKLVKLDRVGRLSRPTPPTRLTRASSPKMSQADPYRQVLEINEVRPPQSRDAPSRTLDRRVAAAWQRQVLAFIGELADIAETTITERSPSM